MTSKSGIEVLAAFVAFVEELKHCGQLDGGKLNGLVWIQCGAHVEHPTDPSELN